MVTQSGLENIAYDNSRNKPKEVGDLTMSNSWVNYNGGFSHASFYVDQFNFLRTAGLIKSGTSGATNTIFSVGAPCIPAEKNIMLGISAGGSPDGLDRFDFLADGTVPNVVTTNNGYVSLEAGCAPLFKDGWTDFTFKNSWVNYDATNWATGQYFKDPFGIVHLKGLIKLGSASGTVIATLPAGYRPSQLMAFPIFMNNAGANAFGEVTIDTNGDIKGYFVGTATYFSLCGIEFVEAGSFFETQWETLTLLNSWTVYVTQNLPLQVLLTPDGLVRMRGFVNHASANIGALAIATLPVKYRPSESKIIPAFENNNTKNSCVIQNDGTVLWRDSTNPDTIGFATFDNVKFRSAWFGSNVYT